MSGHGNSCPSRWPAVGLASCVCFAAGATAGYYWSSRPAEPQNDCDDVCACVTDLFVYPIKSCAGYRVSSAKLTDRGFENDRLFMITDFVGRLQTQRVQPRLATIRPSYTEQGDLLITAPRMKDILLRRQDFESGDTISVTLHRDEVTAIDQGPDVSAAISKALDTPGLKLVYLGSKTVRRIPTRLPHTQDRVSLADVFPYLLTSEASLGFIREKSGLNYLSMKRFRPNIVVGGPSLNAFDEDGWARTQIGDAQFDFVSACTRCKMTRVDPWTGDTHTNEPTDTMQTYRAVKKEMYFGQNLTSCSVGTVVRVGQPVRVLESKQPMLKTSGSDICKS